MIITNKMLLPILLSYYKFTPEQASKLAGKETAGDWLWERIGPLATQKVAWASGAGGRRCCSHSASGRRATCTSAISARASPSCRPIRATTRTST